MRQHQGCRMFSAESMASFPDLGDIPTLGPVPCSPKLHRSIRLTTQQGLDERLT
jgi:hypothetical protein